jgi:hypothetical protein
MAKGERRVMRERERMNLPTYERLMKIERKHAFDEREDGRIYV